MFYRTQTAKVHFSLRNTIHGTRSKLFKKIFLYTFLAPTFRILNGSLHLYTFVRAGLQQENKTSERHNFLEQDYSNCIEENVQFLNVVHAQNGEYIRIKVYWRNVCGRVSATSIKFLLSIK